MMPICRQFRVFSPQYRPLAAPIPQSTRNARLAGKTWCEDPRKGPKAEPHAYWLSRLLRTQRRNRFENASVRGARPLITSCSLAREHSGPLDLGGAWGVPRADTAALNARVCGANARKRGVGTLAGLGSCGAFSQRHVIADSAGRQRGRVR